MAGGIELSVPPSPPQKPRVYDSELSAERSGDGAWSDPEGAVAEGDEPAPKTKKAWTSRFIILLTACGCIIAMPLIYVWLKKKHYETHYIAWVAAGTMVLLTIPIALLGIVQHVTETYDPRLQRLVVRILWMPIVFGVDNWMALRFKGFALYWTALTGWYEAWVLYSFYTFLETYLERGSLPGSLATLAVVTESHDHACMIPCTCLRPWRMADGEFVRKNKIGVLQYTLVQTICTACIFATQFYNKYHDGTISTKYAYMYVTVAVNVSQIVALYCLVYFYHALQEPLKPLHPLPKFLCVKLVIFFSFWQEMVIYGLVHYGAIKYSSSWGNTAADGNRAYTIDEVSSGIQEFLMCGEMLIAAVAHLYAFPVSDYKTPEAEKLRAMHAAMHMLSCGDAVNDIVVVVGCVVPFKAGAAGGADEWAAPAQAQGQIEAAAPEEGQREAL